MDEGIFEPQNPRFSKPMSNAVVPQRLAPPSILDRFKSALKEREEDLRLLAASDDDVVSRLSTLEIVRLYEMVLSELTLNSKPVITDLTIIAGEQREHAEGIADAICARILEVPAEQKLPSLYLLDSIVKNLGREYVRHFSANLPEVFCEAYRQVNPNLYPAMRHLFKTWSAVFPSSVLNKIDAGLQFSPSINNQSPSSTSLRSSESQRPTHSIHVNPKYLETGNQFEDISTDDNIQNAKGTYSLKIYGQKPAIGHEHDSNNAKVLSSEIWSQGRSSAGFVGDTSVPLEDKKMHSSSALRISRSSSPFGIENPRSSSPAVDEFSVDNSRRMVIGRLSPSHTGFGRKIGRDEETSNWKQRNYWPDETHQRFESSAATNLRNGADFQRHRALIDAYGNDERNTIPSHKPQHGELDINGIDSKVVAKAWQNTRVEEFDWEDMSPTLADNKRNDNFFQSSIPPPEGIRRKPGFEPHHIPTLQHNFRRSSWSNQANFPVINGSSHIPEDAVLPINPDLGLISKVNGFHNEIARAPGSRYPLEAWDLPTNPSDSSQNNFNAEGNGRNFQLRFSEDGTSLTADEQHLSLNYRPSSEDPLLCAVSANPSRMTSSGLVSTISEVHTAAVQVSIGACAPLNKRKYQPPLTPVFPLLKQTLKTGSTVVSHGLNELSLPERRLESNQGDELLPQFPKQLAGPSSLNHQNPTQITKLQSQEMSQCFPRNLGPSVRSSTPSHLVGQPISTIYSNTNLGMQSSMPIYNFPNTSLHLPGRALPPLLSGGPSAPTQVLPISQNLGPVLPNAPAGNALSGLFSSLVAQGLISLTKQAPPVQDTVGLEFNLDLLKVRHESAITALYADLPRQCTTCGLRFKCQEDHRSHMDWHVTKNRVSKNRKQKPSRRWFVSAAMWLSTAEAHGNDAVPGFLPTENFAEKQDDEEMAVPADELQNVCALCGEAFDDFYSDETEEWMYRGAVYMNAPNGLTTGMDRSRLGPIVHAKCRSESSSVLPEDFGKVDEENAAEGIQRKRMRM